MMTDRPVPVRRARIRLLRALAILLCAAPMTQTAQGVQLPEDRPGLGAPSLTALPDAREDARDQQSLPIVPIEPPRPALGPESVSSFLDTFKANDAVLELVLGQGRILSTRSDLSGRANQAIIAVGDPSVMDFVVLSPRQIRLTGQRIGTTDLSITMADGKIYNFEVHVVADLNLLMLRLRSLFPDASIQISQVSGNVIVEGQARGPELDSFPFFRFRRGEPPRCNGG